MKKVAENLVSRLAKPDSPGEARREGDCARDARNWHGAEQAYRSYLIARPDDAPIWVQLGHALKEQAHFSEAESAYRTALALLPDSADSHLQLGHVLKLLGRVEEAMGSYSNALELEHSATALAELTHCADLLGRSRVMTEHADSRNGADLTYFEADDLIGFLYVHTTLSGIQRTQIGIFQSLLLRIEPGKPSRYVFVKSGQHKKTFLRLNTDLLRVLFDYFNSGPVDRDRLTFHLDNLLQAATAIQPLRGSLYFVPGAFWGWNADATRYQRLKAAGVTLAVYIYDLIPLQHPEYCEAHLVSDFSHSIGDGLALFDFILTISDHTAREMQRLLVKHNLRQIPIYPVPLAHVLSSGTERPKAGSPEGARLLARLGARPFVLSVSTIEPRKNHAYLIKVWRFLQEEGLEVPDLVFVGRRGWRIDDFFEQLRATGHMDGIVHIVHDLPDADMRVLYEKCLFTAFPSFIEGWGLPVGESLTYGKICVASSTSSIPEVGGDLADYIDPYNIRHGVEVFGRMIRDAEYREQRELEIRARFRPRRWETVASELLGRIATARAAVTPAWNAPSLLPGEIFRPGDLASGCKIPVNYPARPLRLILAEGWFPIEPFGVWMHPAGGTARFKTQLQPGTEIVVYLQLAGSPSHDNGIVRIFSTDAGFSDHQAPQFPATGMFSDVALPLASDRMFSARLLSKVGDNGDVSISFLADGDIPPVSAADHRQLSVGLVALAYAARADAIIRADVAEALGV